MGNLAERRAKARQIEIQNDWANDPFDPRRKQLTLDQKGERLIPRPLEE
jgi:hypothetical protein